MHPDKPRKARPNRLETPDCETAENIALAALGWVLADSQRAERFLALTGLTPNGLRAGLGDDAGRLAVLAAVLDFLSRHEPDLVAAAAALVIEPESIVAAWENLS